MSAHRFAFAIALGASLLLAGCGSGSESGLAGVPRPDKVEITTALTELFVGQSLQLRASALDASGTEIAVGDPVWVSTNPGVVQVSEGGLLMAMTPGTAVLSVTLAGVVATTSVTVEPLPPYDVTIQVGSTFAPASFTVRRLGTVRFVFAGVQQNVTFSRAFVGAPTDIPNTSTGTVTRQFNTVGDFRFESTVTAGLAGFVRVR